MKWGKMEGKIFFARIMCLLVLALGNPGIYYRSIRYYKKAPCNLARGIFSHKRFIENIHNCDIASPYCFQMVLYL